MRRICRELSSNWSAIASRPALLVERAFLQALHDQLRDALRIVNRRAARRQLGPAAQARAEAAPARLPAAVSKNRQFAAFGVFAGQIGRQ